ncbi:MAG: hypothetical protein AAFP98_04610 [Pseudomonadota bacterium]
MAQLRGRPPVHLPNAFSVSGRADVVVVALGGAHLMGAEMTKPGTVVIDIGLTRPTMGSSETLIPRQ